MKFRGLEHYVHKDVVVFEIEGELPNYHRVELYVNKVQLVWQLSETESSSEVVYFSIPGWSPFQLLYTRLFINMRILRTLLAINLIKVRKGNGYHLPLGFDRKIFKKKERLTDIQWGFWNEKLEEMIAVLPTDAEEALSILKNTMRVWKLA